MKQKNLVICLYDREYTNHLMEFLAEKKDLDFQIRACTKPERAEMLAKEDGIEILFVEEEIPKEEWEKIPAKVIFILSGSEQLPDVGRAIPLHKYQSGEKIYEQMLVACLRENVGNISPKKGEVGAFELIGIYSPIHRIGKTTYALQYGKERAKEKRTLYLNLDLFDSGGMHFPQEMKKTLSDVLYFSRQEEGNFGIWLGSAVGHMGELDYVAPMQVDRDLKSVTTKEWQGLFHLLEAESMYDVVILDIGDCVCDLAAVLGCCSAIKMLISQDVAGKFKVQQFRKSMKLIEAEELLERITEYDIGGAIT